MFYSYIYRKRVDYREQRSHTRGVYPTHWHTVYLAHGNNKDEGRVRNRHKHNSERVVQNMERRNVGSIGGKSSKQGLIIAKDLPTTI